ncbi:MAG: hypothetical protein ABL997_08015, partial [Planctomycetota bacterium]
TSTVFVAVGASSTQWNGQPLPLDLGVIGMPQCRAFVSPDVLTLAAAANGTAELAVAIPTTAGLLGGVAYAQALVPDAGINAFGGTVSQGLRVTIGAR